MAYQTEVIRRVIDSETIDLFYNAYLDAFRNQEIECGQNQICFSRESFHDAMGDEDWIKFIVFHEKQPVGLGITTCNMDKARISYMNPEAHIKAIKQVLQKGSVKPFCIPIIAVVPEHQKVGLFRAVLHKMFKTIHQLGGDAVIMDYSEKKNKGLPEVTMQIIGFGHFHEVDRQIFGFFTWNPEDIQE